MSWEDILKEFTPNSEDNEYYQIISLLDYIIENYPERASNAEKVKKDIEELLDKHYELRNKLLDLSQYITRGKSNTLREKYIELAHNLIDRLYE